MKVVITETSFGQDYYDAACAEVSEKGHQLHWKPLARGLGANEVISVIAGFDLNEPFDCAAWR
ncbi:MAG: hypothetical protein A2Z18_10505 [Armatimonadetes bacterium RBG_16_58_9]|nr:MAG: hypothetical protein A2Z18_10505 [Armatimonadetes bacterium RBG_16_58_9]